MKIFEFVMGIIVILLGALPFLTESFLKNYINFIPSEGNIYQLLIIIVGVLLILHGSRRGFTLRRKIF